MRWPALPPPRLRAVRHQGSGKQGRGAIARNGEPGRYPRVSQLSTVIEHYIREVPEREQWLKQLELAPKRKGHIRSLMRIPFGSAMRYRLIPMTQNPISLVRVPGCAKREDEPQGLDGRGVPAASRLS